MENVLGTSVSVETVLPGMTNWDSSHATYYQRLPNVRKISELVLFHYFSSAQFCGAKGN